MSDAGRGQGAGRRPVAFISHHSSQQGIARHLKQVFERNGVTGWMAPDDIEPGLAFDRAIIEQVKRSDMIVLLFCGQSDRSKHVKRELMLAEDHDKLIYPVRLEAIEPAGLAYWLQDYQWIDWIDRRDATIERMIETIKRQVAEGRSNAPAAPALAQASGAPASPAPLPPVATVAALDSSPAGEPRKRGLGAGAWIGIGVFVLLLLMVAGGIVIALSGGEDRADSGGEGGEQSVLEADAGSEPGGEEIASGAAEFEPGLWEMRTSIDEIAAPGLPEGMQQELTRQFEAMGDDSTEQCVTPEEAADPDAGMFAMSPGDNCEIRNRAIGEGYIAISMSCTSPGMAQPMEIQLNGEYEPDAFELDMDMMMDSGMPNGAITMRGQISGERTGDCN